jgi:hypothetical protein
MKMVTPINPGFALLDDRVRMIEGRPQRFGSQVQVALTAICILAD